MSPKQAINYLSHLSDFDDVTITVTNKKVISSGEAEKLGISRQLLRYYVVSGYVRTVPYGKQKRYYLEDVIKCKKQIKTQ